MFRFLLGMVFVLLLALAGLSWMQKRYDHRRNELAEAESAQVYGATIKARLAAASAPAAAPRAIGHGLTHALAEGESGASAGLTCQGVPAPQDQPRQGACDPYRGDTSCRKVLPIACVRGSDGGGALSVGATQALMGALVHSAAEGSARCAAELGEGWRMAEFHDNGVWTRSATAGSGLTPATRYWVHINDQPANCWNSQ